jgi:signal transduction histidine kinase
MSALSPDETLREVVAPRETAEPSAPVEESLVAALTRRRSIGLAGRLLALVTGFVLLAIGFFYVTRLAAFRENWLRERLTAAHTAVVAFDAAGGQELSTNLTREILNSVGAKYISITLGDRARVLSFDGATPRVNEVEDISDPATMGGVPAAFRSLFAAPGSVIRIVGIAPGDNARVEVALDQAPLIAEMWRVSRNFVTLLLTVSTVVTLVLWAALWQMVIRPVRRLTSSIIAFGERPQDASRMILPSGRNDEIGRAETALAAMQATLAHELSQRKRLAELGMAVARINHDLRNMLAAAQLISDRLASIQDPLAQRLGPRLVATLDRAILFCQSTLTYGAAREQEPNRRRFDLREVVRQVVETAEASWVGPVVYSIDIPPKFELFADPDHVQRVIENLGRNAAQALQSQGTCGERPPAIRFAAIRAPGSVALIEISDSGPGFPPEQAQSIFEPFHPSTREGGSGLGLSIAADLVARNGGSITLAPAQIDDFYCGARFLITLPTAEDGHGGHRAARRA